MANYRLTPAAKLDLLEIWNYTFDIWGEKQAEKYLLEIEEILKQLADNKGLGKWRPEINQDYYSFPCKKHVIFYIKSDEVIDIIGILHGKMDIPKYFEI